MTHDTSTARTPSPRAAGSGIALVLLSSVSFSLSGPIGKSLIDSGWTAGSAVVVRLLVGALVLGVPAALALRGRWHLVRSHARLIAAYGTIAVAGCQFAYFNAVQTLPVGVALLIEFSSPLLVLGWLWLRHGQRPGRLTVIGAAVAIAGLALVIDLTSGVDLDAVGLAWAVGAMVAAAFYWILSGHQDTDLPEVALAAGGLATGGVALLALGAVGLVPLTTARADVTLADTAVPWWVAIALLGAVTGAVAYAVGVVAARRTGSRLASFVGLSEAVFGVLFAWLLLAETPRAVQLVGGALILLGVVAIRLGEPRTTEPAA